MKNGQLTIGEFDAAVDAGLVSCSEHGSLALYSYTRQCANDRLWTSLTRAARGIVFDRTTGAVVARPFSKFFNLGEVPETQPDALPADEFTIEEKLDGSLGIIYHHFGWKITTKGAFGSEQSEYAQREFMCRYRFDEVPPNLTLCTEIIYPENRIVIDYGGLRGLVLLAIFETDTGQEMDRAYCEHIAEQCALPIVKRHHHKNLLELPFSDDSEGYVARFANGMRVKVKSPRYIQIHRLLQYCSPKRILEMIASGDYDEIRAQIPDDLADEFDDISASLRMTLRQLEAEARRVFDEIGPQDTRKDFALAVQAKASPEARPLVFALLDEKPLEPISTRVVKRQLAAAQQEGER